MHESNCETIRELHEMHKPHMQVMLMHCHQWLSCCRGGCQDGSMHHDTTSGATASRVWAVRAHLRRLSESGGIRTVPFGPGASLREASQMVRRWNTVSDECHSIPVGHCTHGAAAGLHSSKPVESTHSHQSQLHHGCNGPNGCANPN